MDGLLSTVAVDTERYNGEVFELNRAEEEVATMYALMTNTDYVTNPKYSEIFNKNFFRDWKTVMRAETKAHLKDLSKCDFSAIKAHFDAERDKKKEFTKEQKAAIKAEKDERVQPFLYAVLGDHREKVGNFNVEPPGLFRGRGVHPKMGTLKQRVYPEDIIINIGRSACVPEPGMPGHSWKGVVHNDKVTWLAYWKENIAGGFKYSLALTAYCTLQSVHRSRVTWEGIDGICLSSCCMLNAISHAVHVARGCKYRPPPLGTARVRLANPSFAHHSTRAHAIRLEGSRVVE